MSRISRISRSISGGISGGISGSNDVAGGTEGDAVHHALLGGELSRGGGVHGSTAHAVGLAHAHAHAHAHAIRVDITPATGAAMESEVVP